MEATTILTRGGLLPGKKLGENDSTIYGLDVGGDLIDLALRHAGFKHTGSNRAFGFMAALSWFLMATVNGFVPGSSTPEEDAEDALERFDLAVAGSGLPEDHYGPTDAAPRGEESAAADTATEQVARSKTAALHAAWELDALLNMMLEQMDPGAVSESVEAMNNSLRTRGLLMRIRDLASVLMSFAGDETGVPEMLEKKVFGRALELEASHA